MVSYLLSSYAFVHEVENSGNFVQLVVRKALLTKLIVHLPA